MQAPLICESESDIPKNARRIDGFDAALRELYFAENPKKDKTKDTAMPREDVGSVWVYYPWLNVATRIPEEAIYYRLRTARNRNVITDAEQKKYREACVSIAGLSVGSQALLSLVATGGPKSLHIGDPDTIEITNLNRICATLADIGENKTHVAARKVWELDPFADISLFPAGTPPETYAAFLDGTGVLVEETDSIDIKVGLREAARERRIPVVMATDNGNGAIVDIERFDLEPDRALFHGRVDLAGKKLTALSREERAALASEIIDPSLFSPRQRESVAQIGKSLSGVAQIATAAAIAGAAAAYAVRAILTGGELPSGRYVIACEDSFAASRA